MIIRTKVLENPHSCTCLLTTTPKEEMAAGAVGSQLLSMRVQGESSLQAVWRDL